MRLSYNPEEYRRCIGCPNTGQPPLKKIVREDPKFSEEGTFVTLECGHVAGSIDDFRELHPEWTWS